MKYKDVAKKYDVSDNNIKLQKNRYQWAEKVYEQKKTGAPIGNKNMWVIWIIRTKMRKQDCRGS